MSLVENTASELRAMLLAGKVSSRELVAECLASIRNRDHHIGAFLDVDEEKALAAANSIDQRRERGERLGMLSGLPVAVKDVLCTAGQRTTCGSKILADYRPPYDATVVAKLRDADSILVGKTNMDEFAMGSSTENSAFKVTRNPWNTAHVPGGSSGGAAACVAAGMCSLSIGTDTGGSIRQPAALCGITGIKPTYGRVSRYGLVAFASSLDQAGPMAWSVEDAALLLEAIAGHDPRDSTSVDRPVPPYSELVKQPLEGLRIGLVREHFETGLAPEIEAAVREAVRVFESRGAQVTNISLPHSRYGIATYYVIAPCEASSNLARFDGVHYGYRTDERQMLARLTEEQRQASATSTSEPAANAIDSPLVRLYRQSRAEGFGAEVKRRIMLGTYALSAGYYEAYYLKAQKVRRLIRNDFDAAFRNVDLILGPTTPAPACRIGEKTNDPLAMYLEDLYTVSANLAGIPSMSIPCGYTNSGLPIGLQLQAPPFEEERLIRAGHMFQTATDWHRRRPSQ